jgi:hypothetical protein
MIEKKNAKKKYSMVSSAESTQISKSSSCRPFGNQPTPDSASYPANLEPAVSQAKAKKLVDPTTIDEDQFQEDLTALANELKLEIQFRPTVSGKEISLFRLWQVVQSNKFRGKAEVDKQGLWPQVAQRLNFSNSSHPKVSTELKNCYEDILEDFEDIRRECMEHPDVADSQESELIGAQLMTSSGEHDEVTNVEEQEDDIHDDLDVRPSPVLPSASGKRALVGPTIGESFNKRQRVDKGKSKELEIPSTPEDDIKVYEKQVFYEPSPSLEGSPILNQVQDTFLKSRLKRPELSALKSTNLAMEPDTQDFDFPLDDAGNDIYGDESEVETPPIPSPSFKPNGQNRSRDPTPRDTLHEELNMHENSSTQSQTLNTVSAYVDGYMALGYEHEIIVQALRACSLQTGNAKEVMDALRLGAGIPEDIQGVWTAEDDRSLNDEDGPGFERILIKHGEEFISIRRKFWEDENEAEALA